MHTGKRITVHKWRIQKFCEQRSGTKSKVSKSFALKSQPNVEFEMILNRSYSSDDNNFLGVGLVQFDGFKICLTVKFWLENKDGKKFNEHQYKQCVFNKIGDEHGFGLKNNVHDLYLYLETITRNDTIFVCCELVDLTTCPRHDKEFHQNMWLLYKQEIHDVVIKVDSTEFKVMKAMLMAQSQVFNRMFLSPFEEAKTNVVDVKDVTERAMESFIKWAYTQEIDDNIAYDKNFIEELFVVTDKYQVDLLKEICVDLMLDTLKNENVLPRLALAVLHDNSDLKKGILDHITSAKKEDLVFCFTSPELIDNCYKDVTVYRDVMELIRENTSRESNIYSQ